MTQQRFERNEEQSGMGSFSHIEKVEWQKPKPDFWRLPVIEQGVQSAARGALVSLAGVTASTIGQVIVHGVFWPGFGVSLAVGVGAALWDFQRGVGALFATYRAQELKWELYQKESQAATSQSEASVTIHTYEHKENGQVHGVNYHLGLDEAQLSTLANAVLSQRGLQEAGFSLTQAKTLLNQMIKQNLIVYAAVNKPAQWTAKGWATMRNYAAKNVLEAEN